MRKEIPTWLLILIALIGIGVFLLSPFGIRDSLRQSNLQAIRDKGKEQRKTGFKEMIEWRSLEIVPRIALLDAGVVGSIVGGDFNGDCNEEILFLPGEGLGMIYSPEGDVIPTAINGAMLQQAGAWDYDHDGKMEIFRIPTLVNGYTAAFDEGRSFQTEIYSLDGVVVATLDGLAVKNPELVFDYDGDSKADIALVTGKAEFTIYGSNGIALTRLHTSGNETFDPWLPIIKSLPASFSQTNAGNSGDEYMGAVCIADVNSDKELELVTPGGTLNLQSGEFRRNQFTKYLEPDYSSNLSPIVGDFFKTGFKIVAVPTRHVEKKTIGISLFDSTGSLLTFSEVGYSLLGLLTIRADGHDYLVAHAPDRLLIFP